MTKSEQFILLVNDAYAIANGYFNEETKRKAEQAKQSLVNALEKNSFVKVPFVGDFSAGKSSLINAFLGVDELLPTNITPETAVAYELYYSVDEKIEVWKDNQLQSTKALSDISNLNLTPQNLVKVFINNPVVKSLNDRHIVIVDMPGIDSGVEAHNNAILHYVEDGTHFMLVNEAESGTLRNSTINFIDEVKKYGANISVILSKCDKKSSSEVEKIRSAVEIIARAHSGKNVQVVTSSAADEEVDDVMNILNGLEADSLVERRFGKSVFDLIAGYITDLQSQITLLGTSDSDCLEKQTKLKEEHEAAIAALQERSHEAQPLAGSVQDVLNDVEDALRDNEESFVNYIFSNPKDTAGLNAQLMSTIRPVVANSLQREIGEYSEVIGSAVNDFSESTKGIFETDENNAWNGFGDVVGEIVAPVVGVGLTTILSFLPRLLGTVLGPLATLFTTILPGLISDLVGKLFGPNEEEQKAKIRVKFSTELVGKVVNSLKGNIEKAITEQRAEIDKQAKSLIDDENKKYQDNINAILQEEQKSKEERDQKISILSGVVEKLKGMVNQIKTA